MHRYLLHNREVRNTQEALLSPGQVGFLNGWGVFSTLLVSQGVLFAFERHYARLLGDAGLMHVPFELSADELHARLLSLVEANGAFNSVLRVALVRNKGGLFEAPGMEREFDLVAFTADLSTWPAGVHLTYVPEARHGASPFAGAKITSWAQNLTWYESARQSGFDEAILLNELGDVSECTSANIFVIRGSQVWTPPLSTSGCLPGVTRAILLQEVALESLEIIERQLSPSELEGSDGVFITSTTRDLVPVLTVDGFALAQADSTLSRLRAAFTSFRNDYIENAPSRYLVSS